MILFENHNASIRCSRGRQTHRLNMLRRRFRWNGVPFVKYTSVLLTYHRTYIWNNLWEIHMLYKFWRCHGVLGKWLVRYGEKYPVCEGLSRGVNHIMAKEFYYIKTKRICFIFSTRQQTWLHDSHVILTNCFDFVWATFNKYWMTSTSINHSCGIKCILIATMNQSWYEWNESKYIADF